MKFNIRFPVELSRRIKEKGYKVSTFIRFALERFLNSPKITIPKDYNTTKTMISMPDGIYKRLQEFSKAKNLPISQIIFMAVEEQLKAMEVEQ